jgi:hypothetical protein
VVGGRKKEQRVGETKRDWQGGYLQGMMMMAAGAAAAYGKEKGRIERRWVRPREASKERKIGEFFGCRQRQASAAPQT